MVNISTNMGVCKNVLDDVVIIRLVLILLLVLYHAFAIYNGAWEKPLGVPDSCAYAWIASFSRAFMLEAFVFISGYLLGFQACRNGASVFNFKSLILKKFKRLLLPSLFFSVIYYGAFYDLNKPIGEICYSIINGCGHLWFLPMLFWCFVAIYIVKFLPFKNIHIGILVLGCSVCSFLPLPFRLNSALYYFLFFYLGYWCSVNKPLVSNFITFRFAAFLCISFLGLFIPFTIYSDVLLGGVDNVLNFNELYSKVIRFSLHNLFHVAYSVCGVMMIYITVNLLLKKKTLCVSPVFYTMSTFCFGVYIYQQFILKYLYYYFGLPQYCSSILLPWIAFIITLIGSIVLSCLTVKTRIGRFLIG